MTDPEDFEFEDLRAELAELRTDSPSHEVYTAIRRSVLDEIDRKQTPFWHRAWPVLAAAVACTALLIVATRPKSEPVVLRLPELAALIPHESPLLESVPEDTQRLPVARPRPRRQPKATLPSEPLVMQLVTDDPDVVIYWLSN